jgi:uncharacterized protein
MARVAFKRCPICKKMSQPKFHPFCSNRCKDVDLNRWLGGQYSIPVEEETAIPLEDSEDYS